MSTSTAVSTSTEAAAPAVVKPAKASILAKFAERYSVEPTRMLETLKGTCFKGQVTNEQMIALLIVADQYSLNPFTKEIFAFPDKGSIVPVVSVDGWLRIINSHPQLDGIDFEQNAESCTCIIYRKDRSHPIRVTEWMAECKRNAGPWLTHPYRMLRHKSLIQCARVAFGFAGIYEQDEAERIVDTAERRDDAAATSGVEALKAKMAKKTTTIDADTGEISGLQADIPADDPAMREHQDFIDAME